MFSLTPLSSIGHLGAGALTNRGIHGWRDIFWIQCAFYLISTLLMLGAYYPTRSSDYPRMKFSEYLWAADPIGSLCFMSGTTLTLLALDWTGGTYPWHDAHVGTPLGIGLGLLVVFCVYGKLVR